MIVCSLIAFSGAACAQGWERIYGASGQDEIFDVAPTADGGYIATGYYNAATAVLLLKLDADGRMLFKKEFPGGPMGAGFSIAVTKDGGYAIAGFRQKGPGGDRDIWLIKTDVFGSVIWEQLFGGVGNDEGRDVLELSDGSLLVTGYQTNGTGDREMVILKTDANGAFIWSQKFTVAGAELEGNALALAHNGNIVAAGRLRTLSPIKDDFFVVRLDDNTVLWERTYGLFDLTGNPGDEFAQDIVATEDDGFVLAGTTNSVQGGAGVLLKISGSGAANALWQEVFPKTDFYGLSADGAGGFFVTGNRTLSPTAIDLLIIRTDSEGNRLCETVVGRAGLDNGYSVIPTQDGGALAVGYSNAFFPFSETQSYVVKMDGACRVFTSHIEGNVFQDFNGNCSFDSGEPPLDNWIVRIEKVNGVVRYAVADASGRFITEADTGAYRVQLITPNDYWSVCDSVVLVTLPNFGDTLRIDIPVSAASACPRNEVVVGTPILRHCSENTYTVRYCNSGTVTSLNTRVEVTLDPAMVLVSSSLPASQIGSHTYVFNIGTLDRGDCGVFTLDAFLSCNEAVPGQTHCVSAHIFPDSFCYNGGSWDGSIVRAKAICTATERVNLVLGNGGVADMTNALDYVIIEDVVMLTQPGDPNFMFKLRQGQDTVLFDIPANGKTYRIVAEQSPGYPGLSYPTAAVEGCKSDTSMSGISFGYYTMFPEDDADAFLSFDCQESSAPDYNPHVLKRGHPKGYNADYFISPEAPITYIIYFQNTGEDTVRYVAILDTLSANLDPATTVTGDASHPYLFNLYGQGIVSFNMNNINLPPGGTGYVKFRVNQKPGIACGTKILNMASIYFDFQEPIRTNPTKHTSCQLDTFAVVKTKEIFVSGADVLIYPNPFVDRANITVKGISAAVYGIEVYNVQGQMLYTAQHQEPQFAIWRNQLPAGSVYYRLLADGKPVAAGKLVVH